MGGDGLKPQFGGFFLVTDNTRDSDRHQTVFGFVQTQNGGRSPVIDHVSRPVALADMPVSERGLLWEQALAMTGKRVAGDRFPGPVLKIHTGHPERSRPGIIPDFLGFVRQRTGDIVKGGAPEPLAQQFSGAVELRGAAQGFASFTHEEAAVLRGGDIPDVEEICGDERPVLAATRSPVGGREFSRAIEAFDLLPRLANRPRGIVGFFFRGLAFARLVLRSCHGDQCCIITAFRHEEISRVLVEGNPIGITQLLGGNKNFPLLPDRPDRPFADDIGDAIRSQRHALRHGDRLLTKNCSIAQFLEHFLGSLVRNGERGAGIPGNLVEFFRTDHKPPDCGIQIHRAEA